MKKLIKKLKKPKDTEPYHHVHPTIRGTGSEEGGLAQKTEGLTVKEKQITSGEKHVLKEEARPAEGVTTAEEDVTIGHLIQKGDDGDVVILGFPVNETSHAPHSFRKSIKSIGSVINPEFGFDCSKLNISDSGDVETGFLVGDAHLKLQERAIQLFTKNGVPFVIGGGGDVAVPVILGLAKHIGDIAKVGVISIDSKLDVHTPKDDRTVYAGSQFKQLLEFERFNGKNLVVFASQGSKCSKVHAEYLKSKNSRTVWLREIKSKAPDTFQDVLDSMPDHVHISFDISAIKASDAPGATDPSVIGLTTQDAMDICFLAGRSPKVKSIDVNEFNPNCEERITSKLVGYLFYSFAMGLSQRPELAKRKAE